MNLSQHAVIAQAFVSARTRAIGLSDYPGPVPDTLDDAYAIQALAIGLNAQAIGGWKVGRILGPLSDRFGADRLAGPIFAANIAYVAGDAEGRVFGQGFGAAEAEFLISVDKASDPAKRVYSLDEAADHIGAVHIGIEIASSPFSAINDLGPAVTISDFGNNNGLLIGQAVPDWRALLFADQQVSVAIDGAAAGTGRAASFPDGVLGSVRFLLENLAARGIGLRAGSWISTGAVTGVHQVRIGQHVVADFGAIGQLSCRIVAQPSL